MFNVYLKNCSSFWSFEIFVQLFNNCSCLKSLFEFQKLFMVLNKVSCMSNFVHNFLFFCSQFSWIVRIIWKVVLYFKLLRCLKTSRTYQLDWLVQDFTRVDVVGSIARAVLIFGDLFNVLELLTSKCAGPSAPTFSESSTSSLASDRSSPPIGFDPYISLTSDCKLWRVSHPTT